jgi:heme oxygenase
MTRFTTSTRDKIREATKLSHLRLDAAVNWVDLSRPQNYADFLRGQAEALFPIETALERGDIEHLLVDWPQRARTPALQHDLSVLDTACDPLPLPNFKSDAEKLGAVYVLEGFRMAARVILARLAEQPDSSLMGATTYLRHGFGNRCWPTFLAVLENHPAAQMNLEGVIEGAQVAFAMFESALTPLISTMIDRTKINAGRIHLAM